MRKKKNKVVTMTIGEFLGVTTNLPKFEKFRRYTWLLFSTAHDEQWLGMHRPSVARTQKYLLELITKMKYHPATTIRITASDKDVKFIVQKEAA